MQKNPFDHPYPPELEEEVLLLEHGGEMPEVALAESRLFCGPLSKEEDAALSAACARCYFDIIRRDLNPLNMGHSSFRGLERAGANINRLRAFLAKQGRDMPAEAVAMLKEDLARYLEAEQMALEEGRSYASAMPEQVAALCRMLGLDQTPWLGVTEMMGRLPAPDFLGLRALAKLSVPGAAAKRLTPQESLMAVELLREDGTLVKAALLPLQGPAGEDDPESRERLKAVWDALDYPAAGERLNG